MSTGTDDLDSMEYLATSNVMSSWLSYPMKILKGWFCVRAKRAERAFGSVIGRSGGKRASARRCVVHKARHCSVPKPNVLPTHLGRDLLGSPVLLRSVSVFGTHVCAVFSSCARTESAFAIDHLTSGERGRLASGGQTACARLSKAGRGVARSREVGWPRFRDALFVSPSKPALISPCKLEIEARNMIASKLSARSVSLGC